MRRNFPIVRGLQWLVLVLAMLIGTGAVSADSRSDARTHYLAGQKLYGSADYRGAIREFAAAQQLLPADLNNYNLALCYDKLGEADPAVQYYKEYLAKVPATDKRAEIEASMSRLDAAAKSAAAKKADEERKAADAVRIEEARKAEEAAKADSVAKAESARKAAEAEQVADEARQAEAARNAQTSSSPGVNAPPAAGTTATVSTGDPQLDRVGGIDVRAIRDPRVGAPASGWPADRGAPTGPTGARTPAGQPTTGASVPPPAAPQGRQAAAPMPGTNGGAPEQPKVTPVYKKWWFWAVVAVSGYVVYSIATGSSQSSNTARALPLGAPATAAPGGYTLMRF